jgi:hypothetical protein
MTTTKINKAQLEEFGKYKSLKVKVHSYMGGLHWKYRNSKNEELIIILHTESDGRQNGRFY